MPPRPCSACFDGCVVSFPWPTRGLWPVCGLLPASQVDTWVKLKCVAPFWVAGQCQMVCYSGRTKWVIMAADQPERLVSAYAERLERGQANSWVPPEGGFGDGVGALALASSLALPSSLALALLPRWLAGGGKSPATVLSRLLLWKRGPF